MGIRLYPDPEGSFYYDLVGKHLASAEAPRVSSLP